MENVSNSVDNRGLRFLRHRTGVKLNKTTKERFSRTSIATLMTFAHLESQKCIKFTPKEVVLNIDFKLRLTSNQISLKNGLQVHASAINHDPKQNTIINQFLWFE